MEALQKTDKSDVFNVSTRFKQVEVLRSQLGLPSIDIATYGATAESTLDTPTIGIEIEMSWMQAFPDMAVEWQASTVRPAELKSYTSEYKMFHRQYDMHDRQLKPLLEQVQHVIPRVGKDAYWEFSFLPSKHIGISIAELQTLYDASILHNGIPYATHMTVAEIDNDRDAFAFLCGLELSGGSTAERIETAFSSSKGSWARKGRGGLLKRAPSELMGNDTEGYEFRTLVARSFSQMTSLFHTAQQLAHIYKHSPEEWKAYRSHIESHLKNNDLSLSVWDQPRRDDTMWLAYGALLSQSKKDA